MMEYFCLLLVLFYFSASALLNATSTNIENADPSFCVQLLEKLHPEIHAKPHPAASYQQAIALFSQLQEKESKLPLSSKGPSRLLTHGNKTERVFVLLHGLTSSPEQFAPLAKILFDSGANVVIPRAKEAGFSNLLYQGQGYQSGQDLVDQASEGLDIAVGLGNRVTLIGISAGALAAGWMAEHREGIDQALLMAPFFGANGYPTWESDFLAFLFASMPNHYFWRNKKLKNAWPGPSYAYPRYGTVSIGKTLELGEAVRSYHAKLKVKRLDILFSANDGKVNNELIEKQAAVWAAENPGKVFIYEFSKKEDVPHDSVVINHPKCKIEIVYPKILEILGVKPDNTV